MNDSRRSVLRSAVGIGGLAIGAAIASTTEATAATGATGWLNVLDYGAKGDDSADDQPAIQAAIDAAGQGSTVYFPPGKYRIAHVLSSAVGTNRDLQFWSRGKNQRCAPPTPPSPAPATAPTSLSYATTTAAPPSTPRSPSAGPTAGSPWASSAARPPTSWSTPTPTPASPSSRP
ncbi:glycosyl hydrolase family 28-related protein [Actinacidiphila oryziradicis]|uniref:Rhamnogalacturonase A/B/Epimerase-like pectate lyase domain-containing protein n=1 Tax=Actinacidiphila oryziradicis TaxID=2571141 RepID=A0A4U0SSC5_9ACTN|nr:hypothetical protein FCI23_13095 [Actinacidiphila oryziradicis]